MILGGLRVGVGRNSWCVICVICVITVIIDKEWRSMSMSMSRKGG